MRATIRALFSLFIYISFATHIFASISRDNDDLNAKTTTSRTARALSYDPKWTQALLSASTSTQQETKQDDVELSLYHQSQTPLATNPQSTLILSQDIKFCILCFIPNQKDLLRIGAVSKGWRKAAEKMWKNKTLNLSRKSLTKADYQALAKGIFPRLRLNNVKLNEEGMNILATCSHLRAVEINNNDLHAKGALALAPALTAMTSLTTLNLGGNKIGDKGIAALAPALTAMTSLTTLNLGGNKIGDKGIAALAPSVSALTALTTLDLNRNLIGNKGVNALAPALKALRALTTLDLIRNQIGNASKKTLKELKRSRPSLYINISY